MKQKAAKLNKIQVQVVRSVIEDRAAWLFFLYREIKNVYGKKKAEKLAKKAIRKFGYFKAKKRGKMGTPEKWVKKHLKSVGRTVFKSKGVKVGKIEAELHLHYCPLVKTWKKLGATKKEITLLCDIALEGDRGRAEIEGFRFEAPKTIARGDNFCRLILKK